MSKKGNKKTANKSLETLKRKQYARGGSPAPGGVGPPVFTPRTTSTSTSTSTPPSGGPENKATLIGLDGREYSTNAALAAANKRYLAAQAAENATTTVTTQGITEEAPTGISQKAPVADLSQMEAESILKPVPEAEQWADKYVEQYPDWDETQKAEARAWAVKNYNRKDGEEGTMPSWLQGSDFTKGFEAANTMKFDTAARAPEGTVTGDKDIQKLDDATDATSDTITAKDLSTSKGDVDTAPVGPETKEADKYDAVPAGSVDPTKAAEGKVSKEPVAGGGKEAEASKALKTKRDDVAEEAAKGTAVKRDPNLIDKEYAEGATSDDGPITVDPTIPEPDVDTRTGVTIPQSKIDEIKLDAENRGVDPDKAL